MSERERAVIVIYEGEVQPRLFHITMKTGIVCFVFGWRSSLDKKHRKYIRYEEKEVNTKRNKYMDEKKRVHELIMRALHPASSLLPFVR